MVNDGKKATQGNGALGRSVPALADLLRSAVPARLGGQPLHAHTALNPRPPRPKAWLRRPVAAAAIALSLVALGLGGSVNPASANTCSPNPVVCENAKAGTAESVW